MTDIDSLPRCRACERVLVGAEPDRADRLCDECSAAMCSACRENFGDVPETLCPDCFDRWATKEALYEVYGGVQFDDSLEAQFERQREYARKLWVRP